MADIDVITGLRIALDEKVYELALLVRVLDSCNPLDPPDWLGLMFGRILDLEKSYEAYFAAFHGDVK